MALLEVRKLVKTFGDRNVLDGVSFTLEEGEAKVIMGPSGCGKSTMLRCLNRLIDPTSGEILFDGEDVTRPGVDVRALRSRIGFVFQNFALYRHMSVLDNVALALIRLKKIPKREAEERALHRPRARDGSQGAVLRRADLRARPDHGPRGRDPD
jgi:polar amino acid transport system ATP-binding protein